MWKRLLVALLVFAVVGGRGEVIRHFWLEHQAEQWRQQAEQAAAATWTEDDAAEWLRRHGFDVLRRGEYDISTEGRADEYGYFVTGGLYLDEGVLLLKAAWLDLTFVVRPGPPVPAGRGRSVEGAAGATPLKTCLPCSRGRPP